MDHYIWFFIYFFIESFSSFIYKINNTCYKKSIIEVQVKDQENIIIHEETNDSEKTNNNKSNKLNIQKYLQNNEFVNNLNKILEKEQKKIKRKKIIPINSEELLENFCFKKKELAFKNINDYNFEKHLTYGINDPYVFVIKNSFSNKECDEIINQFENEQYLHYNGVTGGGYTPNTKRTLEINITREKSWQRWNTLCFKRLNYALQKYANHCLDKCHNNTLLNILHGNGKINDTGYQLQKYIKEQQYYKWHQDGSIKQGHNEHRIITYLWYLNTVDEGGETYFYHGKVKPEKGKLVLFPAFWNYNHKGETPISHDKYIITGWVYSDV